MKRREVISEVSEFDSGNPGNKVFVLGGVHGDGCPSVEVVQNLLTANLSTVISRGKLALGIGNPAAVEAGVRLVEGDVDLNRCFGSVPDSFIGRPAYCIAQRLKGIIDGNDFLLHLRSVNKPSRPMIISHNYKFDADRKFLLQIADFFGINTIVTEQLNTHGVTPGGFATRKNKFAVTVQVGYLGQGRLSRRLEIGVRNFLISLGMSDEPLEAFHNDGPIEIYHGYDGLIVGSEGIDFHGEWADFQLIPAGMHVATFGDGERVYADGDSYMLFQKPENGIVEGIKAGQLLRRVA